MMKQFTTASEKRNRINGRLSSKKGMTMAEVLITVAIIMVLMAVAFIAVFSYQRSLAQKQRDDIAKEIFIAAQNHLTMARGEGYMNVVESTSGAEIIGTADSSASGIRYFMVNSGTVLQGGTLNDDNSTVLDMMLPFASIDEDVRSGNNFVISYNLETGKVKEVFYCTDRTSTGKFGHDFSADEYETLTTKLSGEDKKSDRRSYALGSDNAVVVGWYGGDDLTWLNTTLTAPKITVDNGDVLKVSITDPNTFPTDTDGNTIVSEIKLILTGKTSGYKMALDVNRAEGKGYVITDRVSDNTTDVDRTSLIYTYLLDDITASATHFADLDSDSSVSKTGELIPGEDLVIEAVAFSSTSLCNLAYSEKAETNSLYESISDNTETTEVTYDKIAYVSSIRHLENLDQSISQINKSETDELLVVSAKQTADLYWADKTVDTVTKTGFVSNTKSSKVYEIGQTSAPESAYHPVDTNLTVVTAATDTTTAVTSGSNIPVYEGLGHSISDVTVTASGNGGLFSTAPATSVKNLELIDFTVSGSAAGALAGTVKSGAIVENVVAYCSSDENYEDSNTYSISGTNAGGLIGSLSANATVSYCGAAMPVSGTTTAGGLIGTAADSSTVDACFAGGHTDQAEYYTHKTNGDRDQPLYNITTSGDSSSAGGLIGESGATVSSSYSTCSVDGKNEDTGGGFVGTRTAGTITNCYATGLVSGTVDNAFVGTGGDTTTAISSCYIYEIINEVDDSTAGKAYKSSGATKGVTALDDTAAVYNTFVGAQSTWCAAGPYDGTLADYYKTTDSSPKSAFDLMTATQLAEKKQKAAKNETYTKNDEPTDMTDYFVNKHYGDWPAPEIFFINTSS